MQPIASIRWMLKLHNKRVGIDVFKENERTNLDTEAGRYIASRK